MYPEFECRKTEAEVECEDCGHVWIAYGMEEGPYFTALEPCPECGWEQR